MCGQVSFLRLPLERDEYVVRLAVDYLAAVDYFLPPLHEAVGGGYCFEQVALGVGGAVFVVNQVCFDKLVKVERGEHFGPYKRRIDVYEIFVGRSRGVHRRKFAAFSFSAAYHSYCGDTAVVHGAHVLRFHHSGRIYVVKVRHEH